MNPTLSRNSSGLSERSNRILRIVQSFLGLCVCSLGIYLSVVANIGMAPWDALKMGIAQRCPLSFGTVTSIFGLTFIFITRVICKEPIGISTILDPLVCGPVTDIFIAWDPLPICQKMVFGIPILFVAMAILCTGQWIYMKACLGCGPLDSMFVVLGRYFPKLPIGMVNAGVLATVTVIGYFIGGPVGIGTAITVLISCTAMQSVFKMVHFEPRDLKHERLTTTVHAIATNQSVGEKS